MKLLRFIPLAVAAYLAAGCNKLSDEDPDTTLQDVVTYISTSEDNSLSTFHFYPKDDSEAIVLSANWTPNGTFAPGQRLFLSYSTETPGESGPITVKGVSKCPGGEVNSLPPDSIPTGLSIAIVSAWRSGPYLNVWFTAQLSREAAYVGLILDSETISEPFPTLHLTLEQDISAAFETSRQQIIGSWLIADIWNQPGTEGLNLMYHDSLGALSSLQFSKNNPLSPINFNENGTTETRN